MMKTKTIKIISGVVLVGAFIAGGFAYYMFNMPHRNVQSTSTDFSLQATQIVQEYLADAKTANVKYLDEEGDSKILEVSGIVSKITEDFNKNKVVLLKESTEKAGVSCTFFTETNNKANAIQIGQTITVKGVIRAGASYDKDLEMYENVIMEKCDLVK